ncbi:DegT/DnrJ/EryC1/StrS family aminotransferase, partial [Staphylococcus epidermidis]
IGLISLGVKAGDEVILPSNSFAATENSVLSIGAIPVYADVKDDFTICPISIENLITSKTKAILPVHLYGRFCDMLKIKEIALKYD